MQATPIWKCNSSVIPTHKSSSRLLFGAPHSNSRRTNTTRLRANTEKFDKTSPLPLDEIPAPLPKTELIAESRLRFSRWPALSLSLSHTHTHTHTHTEKTFRTDKDKKREKTPRCHGKMQISRLFFSPRVDGN